jgi:DUF1680 family protein
MNASRLIASIAGYFCSTGPGLVAVHLYGGIDASLIVDGAKVQLSERSGYPYDGVIEAVLGLAAPQRFTLALRIPDWTRTAAAAINGVPVAATAEKGYLRLDRIWNDGDRVTLELPMPAERVWAHPGVADDRGRVALQRGPLVYCVEAADTPEIASLALPRNARLSDVRMDLFGGMVGIRAEAQAIYAATWGDALYRTDPPAALPVTMTAIPYYLWNNRGPNVMQVWLREAPATPGERT